MRTALIVSALLGLAVAAPRAQNSFNWDEIDNAAKPTATGPDVAAVSDPVTYDKDAKSQAAAENTEQNLESGNPGKREIIVKRAVNDPCAPQPDGYGPKITPDTPSAFLAAPTFTAIALSAPTPAPYVQAFSNLKASTSGNSYLGLYTLQSYDTAQCAARCNAVSVCTAFNIYIERDPSLNPAPACQNVSSITNFKCTLFGATISNLTATNTGGFRGNFSVVIAGSNGYNKNVPPPAFANYTGPVNLTCAVNAGASYIGEQFFAGPFDASQCAAACTATNDYDRRHPDSTGAYRPCNFFNAYLLNRNGVPQGTTCALYTRTQNNTVATNCGQVRGNDTYTVTNSFGYTRTITDPGQI